MAKEIKDNSNHLNRIHPVTNFVFNAFFLILALSCFLPIIFIFIISITDNNVVAREGYKIWLAAEEVSASAYQFIWGQRATILRALWVSIYVTAMGTVIGVALTCLMGYVLSRKEHRLNGFLTS